MFMPDYSKMTRRGLLRGIIATPLFALLGKWFKVRTALAAPSLPSLDSNMIELLAGEDIRCGSLVYFEPESSTVRELLPETPFAKGPISVWSVCVLEDSEK